VPARASGAVLSVVWIAGGIYLHRLARDLLGDLREP